jgi:hypothetical protein
MINGEEMFNAEDDYNKNRILSEVKSRKSRIRQMLRKKRDEFREKLKERKELQIKELQKEREVIMSKNEAKLKKMNKITQKKEISKKIIRRAVSKLCELTMVEERD